jgi:hypothetical protein
LGNVSTTTGLTVLAGDVNIHVQVFKPASSVDVLRQVQ